MRVAIESAMLAPKGQMSMYPWKDTPEKIPLAIDRYQAETRRLYEVLDKQLADHEFLAGDYSIADMACVGWASRWRWMSGWWWR